ncbi:Uncharacterized protein TCM_007748 [Theobroma cacao]|uniref:Uncharacterized protein n=1 Tax=Theobroma cacao TaxID=3641 RepID=A0A061E4C0_THECC|nr:Uncharacterized protein TCM_007748 [Theobroma cacao]
MEWGAMGQLGWLLRQLAGVTWWWGLSSTAELSQLASAFSIFPYIVCFVLTVVLFWVSLVTDGSRRTASRSHLLLPGYAPYCALVIPFTVSAHA